MIELVAAGSIRVEAAPDVTVVRLAGEIDAALRAEASACMALALTSERPVVIDASEATFIDSSGIAFVMQLHHAASEAGIDVSLRDPRRVLREVLEIIGYSDQLRDADASLS
ncbi:STAS domain-containing protein [Cellulomonas edaphi]|uniref:STAS domain-containing protein n=1 Tax=Cellulomonas edaphi TaxID=3053468 RepID=A0ABT7S3R5_9CELL|nr:STAS domain-containing protein [Cellulomons edaphi]MDM7830241.1 STAS domain-containing protein [Cellulomons edaphi]